MQPVSARHEEDRIADWTAMRYCAFIGERGHGKGRKSADIS
jgi:hypothetical protein